MLQAQTMMQQDSQSIAGLPRKRHLLVVDDSEAMQKLLSSALSFLGYDVTLAGNGLEASTLFVTGSYDLVVTDFQMPLMNGCELSRIVKEQSPKTPVVVVTGCSDDTQWEKLNRSGVDAVIQKPFKLQEIENTVHKLLTTEA